ncbi:hypothetical protein G7Y79_00004g012660 [Physcia stellaris]|nr:hypothetical protein G7Y79_00004g012660 [Physcia stellaris]
MKAFTISAAVAVLLAQAHASPMKAEARQFQAQLTFEGAPPQAAAFTVSIPADGTSFIILNPLSISHISSLGGATCTFFGIDGSETTVVGAQTVDVGPPQTQTFGACRTL